MLEISKVVNRLRGDTPVVRMPEASVRRGWGACRASHADQDADASPQHRLEDQFRFTNSTRCTKCLSSVLSEIIAGNLSQNARQGWPALRSAFCTATRDVNFG